MRVAQFLSDEQRALRILVTASAGLIVLGTVATLLAIRFAG